MEFLSAYNFRLSYRRGQENANADFLSRLPLPPIAEDISGASALTDPDNLGVYLIRACGFSTPACPVPGVGLGGLTLSPCHAPDAVLDGLPLTPDDFRIHRAPMPPTHMAAHPRRSSATLPKAPLAKYAISAPDDAPRPTRRTRSQTATLDGNAPSCPNYRTAAHSGVPRVRRFCASYAPHLAASAIGPPRLHDLYRSPCLDYLDADPPDLQSDPPPPTAPLHPTVPDLEAQAAAAHLSNTLLNYSHSDWEQAQREDPLSDATRRYIQLVCPQPPSGLAMRPHSLASTPRPRRHTRSCRQRPLDSG